MQVRNRASVQLAIGGPGFAAPQFQPFKNAVTCVCTTINQIAIETTFYTDPLPCSMPAAPTPPEQVELSAIPDCIEKAKAAGKGAFFCMPPPAGQDSSPFQTFMAVQSAEVVDGMGITQKKVQGQEVGEIMEDIRKQIVNAMKFGRPLYIDLRKGAPSLQTDYMIDDKFPLEVWDATDHEKVRALCAPCSVLRA
jgi:hypothetical protein